MIDELKEFCRQMRKQGWTCEMGSWENEGIIGYSIIIEFDKSKKNNDVV